VFSGKFSSRTKYGSIQDNVSLVRKHFEKFGVEQHITIIPGTVFDLTANQTISAVDLLLLDADGCIDRDLSALCHKLSSDCTIIIDDIDEMVAFSHMNNHKVIDQKHRLTKLLIDIFLECGILRQELRINNTGFYKRGTDANSTQISLAALPAYRELIFTTIDHLPLHTQHTLRGWVGDNVPAARHAYRLLRRMLRRNEIGECH
jgi:hypothetical protein